MNRILAPQFDALGIHPYFYSPRSISIAGKNIHAGNHFHIISEKHKPVSLCTWSSKQQQGEITIGDHCLISPGVAIACADSIHIGDNCMIAADVNITDSDWHGTYNRTRPFRCSAPVVIEENVWIGLKALIGKGIRIGKNSIVAAGAVVVEDVPENSIVGGNPAKLIKTLNPKRRMLTREFLFSQDIDNPEHYLQNQAELQAYLYEDNSYWHWLKTAVSPSHED